MSEYIILLLGISIWLTWLLYRVSRSAAKSRQTLRAFEQKTHLESIVEDQNEQDDLDNVA